VTERSKRGQLSLTAKINALGFEKFIQEPSGPDGKEENKVEETKPTSKFYKIYCYLVESLSTTVREFRTLRMSEFLGGFTPILLNPRESLSLIKKD
jgi:hypothetical protein